MLAEFLAAAQEWIQAHPQWIVWAIGVIAFLESLALAGIIVPGIALLFAAAAVAGGGVLSLSATLAAAYAGAVLGDGVSFALGRILRDRVSAVWPFRRYPRLLKNGEEFFEQHGGKSVVIGRFVGPIRPIMPLVAGMLGMSSRRFLQFNLLSALGWAPLYILPGYLVGASIQADITWPPGFLPVLAITLMALVSGYYLVMRLHWHLQTGNRLYHVIEDRLSRYNTAHRFWRTYTSPRGGGGEFPLPSLFLAVVCCLLFALLALLVTQSTVLQPLDAAISEAFAQVRNPLLDPFFLVLTLLGDDTLLYIASIWLVGLLVFRGYHAAAIHITIAGIAVALTTHGLKDGFAIPRPDLVTDPPASLAFPSGHSSGIAFFFGMLASFIAQEQPAHRRWRTYAAAFAVMILVAGSRVYLGVHWLTDIVGGLLLGLAICGITRVSYSRYDRSPLTLDMTLLIGVFCHAAITLAYVLTRYSDAVNAYQPL